MLRVTTAALGRLSDKLSRKSTTADGVLRFSRRERGWKLRLDGASPADEAFVHEGKKVLVLDQETSKAMSSKLLDVMHTDSGPRLKLIDASSTED